MRSPFPEGARTRRRRGTCGEDVVDEQDARRHRSLWDACECIPHRFHPLPTGPSRLGGGRLRPADERDRREIELACERPREHASLIEAALGPATGCERHPRHGVCRRRAERGERRGERLPHPAPAGELHPMDRRLGRPPVRERRTRRHDRRRGTVPASIHGRVRRPAAANAPRRLQRDELPGARGAERPQARAASGAGPWEEHVDRALEHGGTLRRASDTDQGKGTSTGPAAPLTPIVRTSWVLSSGYAVTEPEPVSGSKLVSSTGTRTPSAASVITASAPS